MKYADAHCHSNPIEGLGAREIAKRFKKHGGWFIALVSLPPYHYGYTEPSIESYRKMIELLLSEAKNVREEGLEVRVLAGFHPAEADEYFRRGVPLEKIYELAVRVFELITSYHEKGLIDGIGEVGRQHYSTAPQRLVLSELIMIKAFEYAKDHDMIVHLHLEQGGWTTVRSIEELIKLSGISKDKVFLHHVDYETSKWAETLGFWYTIPAKQRMLRKTLSEKHRRRVLVESDFIDDPRRPGVSSYPWDIPRRINELINEGVIEESYAEKIMVDYVRKAYLL